MFLTYIYIWRALVLKSKLINTSYHVTHATQELNLTLEQLMPIRDSVITVKKNSGYSSDGLRLLNIGYRSAVASVLSGLFIYSANY